MKLWCFGDSNTYGYDPCGFFGGRYAAPWPELLAEKTGFQVINDGKNGRMIPEREYEFLQFRNPASELEVLQCQGIIGLLEREVVADVLGHSPDALHYRLSALRHPGVLERGVVTEHTQRSYLQHDEDSCIDNVKYKIAFTQGFIS